MMTRQTARKSTGGRDPRRAEGILYAFEGLHAKIKDDCVMLYSIEDLCMRYRYTMEGLLNPITCGDASANSIRTADEGKYVLLN